MVNEPIRLPDYPEREIQLDRFYCFHCIQNRPNIDTLCVHINSGHSIAMPRPGIDYGDGEMVHLIRLQRKVFINEAAERFACELNSLQGAGDFEFEVGDGAPIEKGDWRA